MIDFSFLGTEQQQPAPKGIPAQLAIPIWIAAGAAGGYLVGGSAKSAAVGAGIVGGALVVLLPRN